MTHLKASNLLMDTQQLFRNQNWNNIFYFKMASYCPTCSKK